MTTPKSPLSNFSDASCKGIALIGIFFVESTTALAWIQAIVSSGNELSTSVKLDNIPNLDLSVNQQRCWTDEGSKGLLDDGGYQDSPDHNYRENRNHHRPSDHAQTTKE